MTNPTSSEIGSIGEHLAAAILLQSLSKWPDKRAGLELFQVDRGADIGIDFILRITRRGRKAFPGCLFAIQVKGTRRKAFNVRKKLAKRSPLLMTFPGPAIFIGVKLEAAGWEICLNDYMEEIKRSNERGIRARICVKEGDRDAIGKIRGIAGELIGRYALSRADVETHLALK